MMVSLKHQGWTYESILDEIERLSGRRLTVRQLRYDMAQVREDWASQNARQLTSMMNEELARIEAMEGIAWKNYYNSSGKKRKENLEEAIPMIKDDPDGPLRPDEGNWTAMKRTTSVEDSTDDQRFWWTEITKLHEERRKLQGLYTKRISVESKVTHKVKGYVSWSPSGWDNAIEGGAVGQLEDGAEEGIYEESDENEG